MGYVVQAVWQAAKNARTATILKAMTQFSRLVFMTLGLLCLVLGFIGAFLPLLPTVPFLLLAALCFSRSSQRLHSWLLSQKRIGPIIRDWEEYGSIGLPAKRLATVMIVVLVSYPLFFLPLSLLLKSIVVVTVAAVLVFIWSRPSGRPSSAER